MEAAPNFSPSRLLGDMDRSILAASDVQWMELIGGKDGLGCNGNPCLLKLMMFDQIFKSDLTELGINNSVLLLDLNFLIKLYSGSLKALVNGAILPKFSRQPAIS